MEDPRDILTYRIPPDVLHYETKYFGFTIVELMVISSMAMLGMAWMGVLGGVVLAALSILALLRIGALGDRSVLVYLVLKFWYQVRPQDVILPRTLPEKHTRIEVRSWDGERLYVMEGRE